MHLSAGEPILEHLQMCSNYFTAEALKTLAMAWWTVYGNVSQCHSMLCSEL